MTEAEFRAFPKLARLNRGIVVTEKIDGTNACVGVLDDGTVFAQSRKRVITPEADNFGFARWVADHAEELAQLRTGYHYGEWWGLGIQRGYGLDEKRFSLFNPDTEDLPGCCSVVPVIGRRDTIADAPFIAECMDQLRTGGSLAAPGFMDPEGIVVYHTASRQSFKATLENDGIPKALLETVAA